FGGLYTYHKFIPNVVSGHSDSIDFHPNNEGTKYANETALYIQDDWELGEKLKINYGLRWSSFSQIGPYTKYVRDADRNKLDSTVYKSFNNIKAYNGLEPRLTLRYSLDAATSLKASLSRNFQFIHLVSNAS